MEVFEIETERLQLRQFRVEDAQDVFAIFSDEQTTLDCGGYHAFDAMDEEYDRLMQKFAGQTRYSVVRKADGRVIGVISLMDAERAVPGWELGIEMAPDVRRQGYAREALAAVIQAFFEKTDTVLFTGGHYAYNTISGELLKKLGFTGVAEILKGVVNPSGKIVDTYATSSLSAPAVVNSGTQTPKFSNVDEINSTIGADERAEYISFQAENIYIGYRYYETRYADCVMDKGGASSPVGALAGASAWNYADEVQYPFGYGLSYTTFQQKLDSVKVEDNQITATVTVTNTGDVAGKSVVQLYAQTPKSEAKRS